MIIKPKGNLSWQEWYKQVIDDNIREIEDKCRDNWFHIDEKGDDEVTGAIKKCNLISVPHTYDAIEPDIRTVGALYGSEMYKVALVGVPHKYVKGEEYEYSLDLFNYVADIYSRVNNIPDLSIQTIFPSRMEENETAESYIQELQPTIELLKILLDLGTPIITTGDLLHGREYYGRPDLTSKVQMFDLASKALDLVYCKKDYKEFLKLSREIGNDQLGVAILLSEVLGKNLEWKRLDRRIKITDYTGVLGAKASVVSMFYKVGKKTTSTADNIQA